MNTLEAIMTRHSYRGKYKSIPVSREDLIKIMEAGLAAGGCSGDGYLALAGTGATFFCRNCNFCSSCISIIAIC